MIVASVLLCITSHYTAAKDSMDDSILSINLRIHPSISLLLVIIIVIVIVIFILSFPPPFFS